MTEYNIFKETTILGNVKLTEVNSSFRDTFCETNCITTVIYCAHDNEYDILYIISCIISTYIIYYECTTFKKYRNLRENNSSVIKNH